MNGNPKSAYWMRSSISRNCSSSFQPDALAVIYYQNANKTLTPEDNPWPVDDSVCGNVSQPVLYVPRKRHHIDLFVGPSQ